MPYAELLRASVFLNAGGATALAAIAVIGAQRQFSPGLLVIGGIWWLAATVIGTMIGRSDRTVAELRRILAEARTVVPGGPGVNLPTPGRVVWRCLWPVPVMVLVAGGLGIPFPEVAAIGAGYALLIALAWRGRERAVLAVEGRDGVRFLVESGRAFGPVKLIRTPGFRSL